MLTVGTKAPDFTLIDKEGNNVSLSDFLGKKIVLYFYPKDNTPGCTRQACAFASSYDNSPSAFVSQFLQHNAFTNKSSNWMLLVLCFGSVIIVPLAKWKYTNSQIKYLQDVMFTAWYNREQKLQKNDIFDMFCVGCMDVIEPSSDACILKDTTSYLISFDKVMKKFIGEVKPINLQIIEKLQNTTI